MDAYTWSVFAGTGRQLAVGITDDQGRARGHVEHVLSQEPTAEIGTEQRVGTAIRVMDAVAAWPVVGESFVCVRSDTAETGFRWTATISEILGNETKDALLCSSDKMYSRAHS